MAGIKMHARARDMKDSNASNRLTARGAITACERSSPGEENRFHYWEGALPTRLPPGGGKAESVKTGGMEKPQGICYDDPECGVVIDEMPP
jgi:hypothetical protein